MARVIPRIRSTKRTLEPPFPDPGKGQSKWKKWTLSMVYCL
jgi:hypothetical protein